MSENKGIAVYIPEADFSKRSLGKIGIITENIKNSIYDYGKALMMPEHITFEDKNLGSVTITDDVPLDHIDIYIYDKYWNETKKRYIIEGKGTVAIATFFPNVSKYVLQGVKWGILEGNEYVKISKVYQKVDGDDEISNIFSNSCHIQINPGTVNKKIKLECYSISDKYDMVHDIKEFYVTYSDKITEEIGFFEIEVNGNLNTTLVEDEEIEIKVHFYPKHTSKGQGFFDFSNKYYNEEALNNILLDKQLNTMARKDSYERLKKKMNVWLDLVDSAKIDNNYYDKKTDSYIVRCVMKIPHCWLTMKFLANFYCTSPLSYSGVKLFQTIQFDFRYKNTHTSRLSLKLNKNIGYIPLSSPSMLYYCNFSATNKDFTTLNKMDKLWFKNTSRIPKLISTSIYTPELLIKDKVGEDVDFISILFITKSLDEKFINKDYDVFKSLIMKYGDIFYDINTQRFYMIYSNKIYDYIEDYHDLTENTYVYCNGNIYKILLNEDTTYSLSIIYENDFSENHFSSFDINSVLYLLEPAISSKEGVLNSTTILLINEQGKSFKPTSANTIGYNFPYYQVTDYNPFYVDNIYLDKIINDNVSTFSKYMKYDIKKEITTLLPPSYSWIERKETEIGKIIVNISNEAHFVYKIELIKLSNIEGIDTFLLVLQNPERYRYYIVKKQILDWTPVYYRLATLDMNHLKVLTNENEYYLITAYTRNNLNISEKSGKLFGNETLETEDNSKILHSLKVLINQEKNTPFKFSLEITSVKYEYIKMYIKKTDIEILQDGSEVTINENEFKYSFDSKLLTLKELLENKLFNISKTYNYNLENPNIYSKIEIKDAVDRKGNPLNIEVFDNYELLEEPEVVDMGFAKWSSRNIGAIDDFDKGESYPYNFLVATELLYEEYLEESTYNNWGEILVDENILTISNTDFTIENELDKYTFLKLNRYYDIATEMLGGKWKTPDINDFVTLFQKTDKEIIEIEDTKYIKYISKINGNSFICSLNDIESDNILFPIANGEKIVSTNGTEIPEEGVMYNINDIFEYRVNLLENEYNIIPNYRYFSKKYNIRPIYNEKDNYERLKRPISTKEWIYKVKFIIPTPIISVVNNKVTISSIIEGGIIYFKFNISEQFITNSESSYSFQLKKRDNITIYAYISYKGFNSETIKENVKYTTIKDNDNGNGNNNGIFNDKINEGLSFMDEWEDIEGDVEEENKYKPVDLGLSVLWCDKNVGAENIEDIGCYSQYGNSTDYYEYNKDLITTDNEYSLLLNGYGETILSDSYKCYSSYDNKNTPLSCDVAQIVCGLEWHTPSKLQIEELIRNTKQSFDSVNGQEGIRFTAFNGNSIFIPYGGYINNGLISNKYEKLYLWSLNCVYEDNEIKPFNVEFSVDNYTIDNKFSKFVAMNIRPVSYSQKTPANIKDLETEIINNEFRTTDNGLYYEIKKEELLQKTFSNNIFINYGNVKGECEDITKYNSVYELEKAINLGKIQGNLLTGELFSFIIYTKDNIFDRYTYYKDYPTSISQLLSMRNVAEIDLAIDSEGNIVNNGWGAQPIISNIKENINKNIII